MSYDRVLPNPASLRYESAPVSTLPRPSDLLDHKIMNDHRQKSYTALPHRPAAVPATADNARYTSDMRPNGVAQTHQHLASYGRGSMNKDPGLSPVVQQHAKPGPMISTKDLGRDRSTSCSGNSSPTKSVKSEGVQFCLCQPDPKIPRPRNGEFDVRDIVV
jgi:HMG box factor